VSAYSDRVSIRSATLAVALVVLVSACGLIERPQPAQWIPLWEDAKAILPDLTVGEPSEAECSAALVLLREAAPALRPTPDDSIDETVDRWLLIAEETMFECPADTGDLTTFDAAYLELDRLADQVDVVVYDS
jgi:hypothetical protein